MAKKISKDTNLGDRGIALIDLRVGEMGLVWHHRPRDAGIDGQIESRDAATGEVFNRFILVQSKASDRPFPGESPDSDTFHYLCKKSDVDYWMSADEPVIVVCSHPTTYEAWWAHVQGCFSDSQQRTTRRLLFNKRTGAFDRLAATRLLDLSEAAKSGYMAAANRRPETLESNLMRVASMPSRIFATKTSAKDAAEMSAAYRLAGMREQFGWILRGNKLYSFADLATSVPTSVMIGDATMIETESWARSGDPEARRNLVALLNRTLHQDHATTLDWNDRRKYLYFKANQDRSQIKIPSSINNSRTVVMPKPGKLPGAGYFWHAALKYRFMMIDGAWHVALIPTYHFTRDGVHEAVNRTELLHGIKLLEKNKAVLSFTRTWARYLRGDDRAADGLFPVETRLLAFGDLATFDVDQGIDDGAWAATGSADEADTGQLDLFDDYVFEEPDDL